MLDLERAMNEAGRAPAIFDGDAVMSYQALFTATHEPPPLLVRATPTRETVLAIHRAFRHRRAYAPIAADTPPSSEPARLAVLRALPLAPTAAAVIATSGSTAAPKLVELSRSAYEAHAETSNRYLDLRADDRWLITLPFDHTGGLSIVVRCLAARAAVIVGAPPPLSQGYAAWLSAMILRHGATRLSLVPAQLAALVDDAVPAPASLRSVLLGGQALAPAIYRRARALGWPIVRSYGLTETCGMCAASTHDERDDAMVALDGTRFRIEHGLLQIASTALATSVHGAPQALADGWLRTADRAELDGPRLRVLGRADDLIVSGGRKIDPHPIEDALAALDAVSGSVVVDVPDARYGAIVCALVVPARSSRTPAELRALIEDAVAPLPRGDRPRRVELVDALPRLPSGKIDRRAARALALQLYRLTSS
jgi:O-succinylbenzoic acid--CoA ligase